MDKLGCLERTCPRDGVATLFKPFLPIAAYIQKRSDVGTCGLCTNWLNFTRLYVLEFPILQSADKKIPNDMEQLHAYVSTYVCISQFKRAEPGEQVGGPT